MWQTPIGSTWQIPIDSNWQIQIDSIWQIPMITIVSLFWLHPLALHCDQIILSGGGYSLLTEISTNVIMVNDKMILLYFWKRKIVKSYKQARQNQNGWLKHLSFWTFFSSNYLKHLSPNAIIFNESSFLHSKKVQ